MNKRGNIDSPNILVILFVSAFMIMATFLAVSSAAPAFADDAIANGLVNNIQIMLTRIGNNGFAMAAFALILFNMIGAFFIFTHPIFVIIDIIFMPFSIFVAAIISNAYEASLETLAVASSFGVMNFIMTNLPLIIVFADILTAILAYALFKDLAI